MIKVYYVLLPRSAGTNYVGTTGFLHNGLPRGAKLRNESCLQHCCQRRKEHQDDRLQRKRKVRRMNLALTWGQFFFAGSSRSTLQKTLWHDPLSSVSFALCNRNSAMSAPAPDSLVKVEMQSHSRRSYHATD